MDTWTAEVELLVKGACAITLAIEAAAQKSVENCMIECAGSTLVLLKDCW